MERGKDRSREVKEVLELRRTWSCPVIPMSTFPRPTNRGISEAGRNNLEMGVYTRNNTQVMSRFVCSIIV